MSHGVRQDIVALTELDHIGSVRARLLAGAGLRTPDAIAAADVAAIETAIAKGAQHSCCVQYHVNAPCLRAAFSGQGNTKMRMGLDIFQNA